MNQGFGFVPDWDRSNTAPSRKNKEAYYPVSIAATVREATFSETLSGILDADPSHDIADLETAFKQLDILEGKSKTGEKLWEAFLSGYGVSSGGFKPKSDSVDYIVPFDRTIATTIEIDQRQWWGLYWLLMTDPEHGVDTDLHDEFVEALFRMRPANLIEELVIEAAGSLDGTNRLTDPSVVVENNPYIEIPPLIPGCADAFREDLRSWLSLQDEESSSGWMLGLRDILNFHYMMYLIQVGVTLDEEYESIADGPPYEYEFELQPLAFGLDSERASASREFVEIWKGDGISRALYDSWGRLAVLNHLVNTGLDPTTPVESKPYTLTQALNTFPPELQSDVVDQLLDEFPADQRPEGDFGLAEAALKFSHAVRRYYENMGRTPSSQTAYSAGENSIRDLGKGEERGYIERRKGVGTILRLDRGSLRLFARLFDARRERGHIDEFWEYMRQRGIKFDQRTKNALIDQLEGMGLLQKQSDSGEAMYVETI